MRVLRGDLAAPPTYSMETSDRHASPVDDAIESRMSTRAFTAEQVDRACAGAHFGGGQPGTFGYQLPALAVYALTGASRDRLVDQVCAAHDADANGP